MQGGFSFIWTWDSKNDPKEIFYNSFSMLSSVSKSNRERVFRFRHKCSRCTYCVLTGQYLTLRNLYLYRCWLVEIIASSIVEGRCKSITVAMFLCKAPLLFDVIFLMISLCRCSPMGPKHVDEKLVCAWERRRKFWWNNKQSGCTELLTVRLWTSSIFIPTLYKQLPWWLSGFKTADKLARFASFGKKSTRGFELSMVVPSLPVLSWLPTCHLAGSTTGQPLGAVHHHVLVNRSILSREHYSVRSQDE